MEQSRGGQRETDGVASLAGGTLAGRVRRDWSLEKKASLYPSYFQRLGDAPTLLRDGLSEHDDVEPEICSWLVLPPFQRRTKILHEHKHFPPFFQKWDSRSKSTHFQKFSLCTQDRQLPSSTPSGMCKPGCKALLKCMRGEKTYLFILFLWQLEKKKN